MLGELAGEVEADGGLDLAGSDGGLLVDAGKLGGFEGDFFEGVVHEGVHDRHGTARDAGVGVDLLEHLVHVDLEGLGRLLLPLLLLSGLRLRAGGGGLALAGARGGLLLRRLLVRLLGRGRGRHPGCWRAPPHSSSAFWPLRPRGGPGLRRGRGPGAS